MGEIFTNATQDMCRKMNLPEEVLGRLPVITMVGNRSVCIENFDKLIDMSDEKMVIGCKKGKLKILGKELWMLYYTSSEIMIRGKIGEIVFEA